MEFILFCWEVIRNWLRIGPLLLGEGKIAQGIIRINTNSTQGSTDLENFSKGRAMKMFRSLMLGMVFLLPASVACSGQSSSGFLSFFDEVTDGDSVLVGTVISVTNSVHYLSSGNAVNIPEISLGVKKSLHGDSSSTETLYGFNSFYQRPDGSWAAKMSADAPWILEGDKILCLVKIIYLYDEAGNVEKTNMIKIVRFLDKGSQFDESSPLLDRVSSKINQAQWKENKFTEFPERIWGCVNVTIEEDTGYTIGDIAQRLIDRQGAEK